MVGPLSSLGNCRALLAYFDLSKLCYRQNGSIFLGSTTGWKTAKSHEEPFF